MFWLRYVLFFKWLIWQCRLNKDINMLLAINLKWMKLNDSNLFIENEREKLIEKISDWRSKFHEIVNICIQSMNKTGTCIVIKIMEKNDIKKGISHSPKKKSIKKKALVKQQMCN